MNSTCLTALLVITSTTVFAALPEVAEVCPPPGSTRHSLLQLQTSGFALEDDAQRNAMAVSLLGCTGDPDPSIRDGVAYGALSAWLRARLLGPDTVRELATRLVRQLRAADDPAGFRKPFAALILSEVARTDRIEPTFSTEEREGLVRTAAEYLSSVSDYRGYSETEGWRHGVAHGADLVLQLTLNPKIDAFQTSRLLDAVASQIAPGTHFYIYGEPGRLARPVYYAYQRGGVSEQEWAIWFDKITDPSPMRDWNESFSSQVGLARRHNAVAFLRALYVAAESAGNERDEALAQTVLDALARL